MELRLAKKRVVKRNYCFGFWVGEIIACPYASENAQAEREVMIIGEWRKTSGIMPCRLGKWIRCTSGPTGR